MWLIDADGSFTINATDNTSYSLAFGGGIISCADESGHIVAEFFADDLPAVDAAPVVRCRDCDHLFGTLCAVCGLLPRKPDDFCSYGERKEG